MIHFRLLYTEVVVPQEVDARALTFETARSICLRRLGKMDTMTFS